MSTIDQPHKTRGSVELPTLAIAAVIYGGWFALTVFWHRLPWPVVLIVGGTLGAWHGSLQHEAIHLHPTRSPRINAIIASALPLSLWLPYGVYRESHLIHHDDRLLTDPEIDPESHYVSAETWARIGAPTKALLWANQTLLGRLVVGPWVAVFQLLHAEIPYLLRGDAKHWQWWFWHLLGSAALLLWAVGYCQIPIWQYAVFFVYPSLSLTLLRSYNEHRARPDHAHRTAIIESNPVWGTIYLYNNLHVLHHRTPGTAWYRLPAMYRELRPALIEQSDHFFYRGYGELFRKFALRAKDHPRWPLARNDNHGESR